MSAPSRRCSTCGIDWPDNWTMYGKCPQCEAETARFMNGDPLDVKEAQSLKSHLAFEAFYAEREAERQRVIAFYEQQLEHLQDLPT